MIDLRKYITPQTDLMPEFQNLLLSLFQKSPGNVLGWMSELTFEGTEFLDNIAEEGGFRSFFPNIDLFDLLGEDTLRYKNVYGWVNPVIYAFIDCLFPTTEWGVNCDSDRSLVIADYICHVAEGEEKVSEYELEAFQSLRDWMAKEFGLLQHEDLSDSLIRCDAPGSAKDESGHYIKSEDLFWSDDTSGAYFILWFKDSCDEATVHQLSDCLFPDIPLIKTVYGWAVTNEVLYNYDDSTYMETDLINSASELLEMIEDIPVLRRPDTKVKRAVNLMSKDRNNYMYQADLIIDLMTAKQTERQVLL